MAHKASCEPFFPEGLWREVYCLDKFPLSHPVAPEIYKLETHPHTTHKADQGPAALLLEFVSIIVPTPHYNHSLKSWLTNPPRSFLVHLPSLV